jgi:hypothetical protein
MARELADVLHHFLGEASPGERAAPATLALLSEAEDAFAVAVAWNLAHELARLGLAVAWVTSLADEDLLPPDATPGVTRLLSPAQDLAGLARAAGEAAAKLARGPGLVLVRVPPGWIAPGTAADELLAWTLQLSAPESSLRSHTIAVTSRVFAACPSALLGVAVCDVRGVREAGLAFDALARECAGRSDAPLTSYGVVLDDAELYRSLLARRPLALLRPDARATRSVADVARLLRADLAGDG